MANLSISSIRHHPSYLVCAPTKEQTRTNRIARWISRSSSSDNVCLDSFNDISYIIVTDVWTGRKTHTHFKECFRHTIHVSRNIFIAWLLMHGLPDGPCLYLSLVKSHAQCLYIGIGLAVSMSRRSSMDDTRSTTVTFRYGGKSVDVAVSQAGKPEPEKPTPPEGIVIPDGYELDWNDEFDLEDGSMPDADKWRFESKPAGWVNHELQTYVPGGRNGVRTAFIEDGVLNIRAIKDGKDIIIGADREIDEVAYYTVTE